MAELDRSRELVFDHGTSGRLAIKIPITAPTPEWSAALHQLTHDQHVDVLLSRDRHHVILQIDAGRSRDDLLRRLELLEDLVGQASRVEREELDGKAPLEQAAMDWWRRD